MLTFTTVDSTGANVTATGGSFQLHYCNGYGVTFVSHMIAFNATQADVQTAISHMTIYGGILTTAGATNVNALGGLVLTMTMLNDFDTAVQGARWSVTTSSLRSATGPLFINMQDAGESTQVGVAPGTYRPYILFTRFMYCHLSKQVD